MNADEREDETAAAPAKWPRLSATLCGPRDFWHCQACGTKSTKAFGLVTWQECDSADEPQNVYLRLCKRCAERIIEPHPRAYFRRGDDVPGLMSCCGDCDHQEGLRCGNPAARSNGGAGIAVRFLRQGIACSRGPGGGCRHFWHDPVCGGHSDPAKRGALSTQ